ncbi:hypothetical protein KI688_004749 [Linnemannia hyalina]|uniref:Uncharacterized protein n=1 Tax=Linnemannia hyalina TaxID=64524 RepID=A0A9P7XNI5_9FUNG|nr:hypothetical protein KI688_004749 [Linnemannia hyalina]
MMAGSKFAVLTWIWIWKRREINVVYYQEIHFFQRLRKVTPARKKRVESSSEEESSSESSSEDETPKKSRKKKKASAKKSKKDASSSEESSSSDDEDVVEIKEIAPSNNVVNLADELIAIANQFAVSNANQTKILDMLGNIFAKMEVRERKNEVDGDILETIDRVVDRNGTITIGTGTGQAHRFESIDNLRVEFGKLVDQSGFSKIVDDSQYERDNGENETLAAAI